MSGEEVTVVGRIDSKTTGVSNRRFRIDLTAIKEALEVGDGAGIWWIESEK